MHGEDQIIGMIDRSPVDITHCFFQDPVDNTPGFAHRKVLQIRNDTNQAAPSQHVRRGLRGRRRLQQPRRQRSAAVRGPPPGVRSARMSPTAACSPNWRRRRDGRDDPHQQLARRYRRTNPASYNQNAADVDDVHVEQRGPPGSRFGRQQGRRTGPSGNGEERDLRLRGAGGPKRVDVRRRQPGPTADGRRKPDLVGVGCGIASSKVGTASATRFLAGCAHELATPHIAGTAALARQYDAEGFYPTGTQQPHHAFTPSGALLKATLINGTIDMTGEAGYPSDLEGWGLIRLQNVLPFPGSAAETRVWDTRHATGAEHWRHVHEHHLDVATGAQPLRVTLVWTDAPGAANSATPVVNDLNLEVVSPGRRADIPRQRFRGRRVDDGRRGRQPEQRRDGARQQPGAGDWMIRVVGTAVNVGQPVRATRSSRPGDLAGPAGLDRRAGHARRARALRGHRARAVAAESAGDMGEVADYIDRVSYGQATVVPAYRGTIDLDHNKDYYYDPGRNLLIELTEEVVAKLVAAEPNVLDTVERLIIVTNDVNFTGDWATTGPWPYDLPGGFTRPISVSVQSYANPAARFTHGMLHQFGRGRSLRARRGDVPASVRGRVGQHGRDLQQRAPARLVEGTSRMADGARRHDPVHSASGAGCFVCGA